MKRFALFALLSFVFCARWGVPFAAAQAAGDGQPAGETGGSDAPDAAADDDHDDDDHDHDDDHAGEPELDPWHDDYDCVEGDVEEPEQSSPRDPKPAPGVDVELASILAKIDAKGDFPTMVYHREPDVPHRWVRVGVRPDWSNVGTLPDGRQFVDVQVGEAIVRLCTGAPTTADAAWTSSRTPWLYLGDAPLWTAELQKVYFMTTGEDGEAPNAHLVDLAVTGPLPDCPVYDKIAWGDLEPETQAEIEEDSSCEGRAFAALPHLPHHLSPVYFPKMNLSNCGQRDACFYLKRAWILAHHNAWRAWQMIEFIEAHPHSKHYLWNREGMDAFGFAPSSAYRASDWFGKTFESYRYDAVRKVVHELFIGRVVMNQIGGFPLTLMCPSPSNVGDLCFTATPSAHHGVVAQVSICDKGWDKYKDDPSGFSRLLLHEIGHHLSYWWKPNQLWLLRLLADKHKHKHGAGCNSDTKNEHMKSFEKAFHLGNYSYDGTPGANCGHWNIAAKNVDSYARWMTELGMAVYTGELVVWPKPPPKGTNGSCDAHPQPGGAPLGPDAHNSPCKGVKGVDLCGGLPQKLGALNAGAIYDTDCLLTNF